MKNSIQLDSVLGELTPALFLRDYWHKKPLLIRQALPGFKALLSSTELFALAAREDVESRLVAKDNKAQWKMQNGPFRRLPAGKDKQWTLLVQGVNLHDDRVDALLRRFRFIPDARLDDLMISYADDGGGVGPHFDSYDVFLLQAEGQRRWQIGAQEDLTLVEGAPLKILRNFTPSETFVLDPGDMLYLPPHYAHDGVAIGACMTYSIGFRAPTYQELGEAFLDFMVETIDLPERYADPDLAPTNSPAEISKVMLARVVDELNKVRFTEEDIATFLGEYLSEPKASVFFDPPAKEFTPAAFDRAIDKHGVALSRRTQMLYRGRSIFINGESFDAGGADKTLLMALANARSLDGAQLQTASADLRESLYLWYQDGWLRLN